MINQTQFAFLSPEFNALAEPFRKAESYALNDPRGACYYARLALEGAVKWAFEHDSTLRPAYESSLSAMIHERTFRERAGDRIVTKAKLIKDFGNMAAHDAHRKMSEKQSRQVVQDLFHFAHWFARTYGRAQRPPAEQQFDQSKLEKTLRISTATVEEIKKREAQRIAAEKALEQEKADRLRENEEFRVQLEALKQQITATANQAEKIEDRHDYGEAATRDAFIDKMLFEAGWNVDAPGGRTTNCSIELPVTGMPNNTGEGFVDYVLWDQLPDGRLNKPLAIVEAKRARKDPNSGKQQAKLYADCLEAQYGFRSTIFYTNGYEHYLWEDAEYNPRAVSGFLTAAELKLRHNRRSVRKPLASIEVDPAIAGRSYQVEAIRQVGQGFEGDNRRKALLVMATGTGKTRTTIALVDQLLRAGWVKRVLFLADRISLVEQAQKNFVKHLPNEPTVNLQKTAPASADALGAVVCFCTYQSMMGLIDSTDKGRRPYGAGHFDLVVVDEAHRSIYKKFGAIFDYFDSYLVGLTATPRDEVNRDTYELFDMETGVPTFDYPLEQAIEDGYLVPPVSMTVGTAMMRDGLRYDELDEDQKEHWDELDWGDDDLARKEVLASEVNKQLFNIDTVDQMLRHLMEFGIKVDGGERLGKTIIFAASKNHAQFITERFEQNNPQLPGFAVRIDYSINYAQSLIEQFEVADQLPQIAVSVDMLDTGIDVPSVVNLVFFKVVRSKTKFWQMVGRGTRLCPDLLAPGRDKEEFQIFDYCGNLEFFSADLRGKDPKATGSLAERLMATRVDILGALQDLQDREPDDSELMDQVRGRLISEVSGMNLDNFQVRRHRREVERFQTAEAWEGLSDADREVLKETVAGLPTAVGDGDPKAKQFDLVMLTAQLQILEKDAGFKNSKKRIMQIASQLEQRRTIPQIEAQLELILDLQSEPWWEGITPPLLEQVRKKLRELMTFIEKEAAVIVYSNFGDSTLEPQLVDLITATSSTVDRHKYKKKLQFFLADRMDDIAIIKLRQAKPLTSTDVEHLESILIDSGVTSAEDLAVQAGVSGSLASFLRSIVGLERPAILERFGAEFDLGRLSADQLEFINFVVDHLTKEGALEMKQLFERPFTDKKAGGVISYFPMKELEKFERVLVGIEKAA